jgi:hypothetical protein
MHGEGYLPKPKLAAKRKLRWFTVDYPEQYK